MYLHAGPIQFRITIGNPAYTLGATPRAAEFLLPYPAPRPLRTHDVRVHISPFRLPSGAERMVAADGWSVYRDGRTRLMCAPDMETASRHRCCASWDGDGANVWTTPEAVAEGGDGIARVIPFSPPIDHLLCVYALANAASVILHSCGVTIGGRGLILAGRSGAGKSTTARLLQPLADVTGFSDDRIIACRSDAGWLMHGTPWPGDAGIARNLSAPLSALLFLTKAEDNAMVPIEKADALRRMLIVASVPWYDAEYMPPVLDTIDRLLADVPCYEFRFRNDPSAADAVVAFARTLPPQPLAAHSAAPRPSAPERTDAPLDRPTAP